MSGKRYDDVAGIFRPVYIGKWRRILLRHFPFGIVYEVMGNQVVVVAIIHTRRKPGYWMNRVFEVLPDRK